MAIFYILHEIHETMFPNVSKGKEFARVLIIGFLIYYVIYFSAPISSRVRHFFERIVFVDIIASTIFYGGMMKYIRFFGDNTQDISTSEISEKDTEISESCD